MHEIFHPRNFPPVRYFNSTTLALDASLTRGSDPVEATKSESKHTIPVRFLNFTATTTILVSHWIKHVKQLTTLSVPTRLICKKFVPWHKVVDYSRFAERTVIIHCNIPVGVRSVLKISCTFIRLVDDYSSYAFNSALYRTQAIGRCKSEKSIIIVGPPSSGKKVGNQAYPQFCSGLLRNSIMNAWISVNSDEYHLLK